MKTIGKIQKTVKVAYIRFTFTTCLYLIPNNRARSLSTLIAVSVNKDTEQKKYPVTKAVKHV